MPVIDCRGNYRLAWNQREQQPLGTGVVRLSSPGEALLQVSMNGQGSLTVIAESRSISEKLMTWLASCSKPLVNDYPIEIQAELTALLDSLRQAAGVPAEMLKYVLGFKEIHDSLVELGSTEWRNANDDWRPVPFRVESTVSVFSRIPLSQPIVDELQEAVDAGFRPFVAMRHLHRAIAADVPRSRWIEATIAAELAAKEAMIIRHPHLAKLLLELPSPPLDKLYGSLAQEYLGEPSPYRKEIAKGAETRNRLIHRPASVSPTAAEAKTYVNVVNKAVIDMFAKAYPTLSIVSRAVTIAKKQQL